MSAQPIELHPMLDVEDEPTVLYSPTGSVIVTRGEHSLRFRTVAAFEADIEAMARQKPPARSDGLYAFDEIRIRCHVKVAGEWHWVDAIDRDTERILVRPATGGAPSQPFWYQATDGERFLLAEPF